MGHIEHINHNKPHWTQGDGYKILIKILQTKKPLLY